MSQTVKIDAAAQDAIVEIVGTPWEKDYYDNTNDDERDYTAMITREGTAIRVLVSGEGYPAYMWHYEAEQIANSILRAAKDAKAFQKAETEWAGIQMQRLNCEITGAQNMWGYGFYVNGRHYEVNFTTNEKARTCVILNQAAKPRLPMTCARFHKRMLHLCSRRSCYRRSRRTRNDRNRNCRARHPPRTPVVLSRSIDLKSPRTRKPTHRSPGHGQHRRRSKEVHGSALRREAERKPCRP